MAILGAGIIVICSILARMLFGWRVCLLFLSACSLIFAVFVYYTNQRYKGIEALNDYLSRILSGDYVLDIQNNEEGELSILQNNIYKTTVLLKEKNELLIHEKKYLGDMIANISHQLKTPLTSMMMMNELLSEEETEEKHREFLKIEEKQLEKMNWLISTLLKLSKLDAGTVQLKPQETAVSVLIDESLAPFNIQMELKEIMIEKRLVDSFIRIDFDWTTEALRNIIKNCVEHMNHGGTLRIENSENNLYQTIIISDTGSGISEDDLPHIFERFYKSKSSSKEGAGIGLSLSKTIIENQRGIINVTSKINHGSRFEIRFYKSII